VERAKRVSFVELRGGHGYLLVAVRAATPGNYFLRATGADETRHLFRHNNFYGHPASRTHLTDSSPNFSSYFDATGIFY
jgi:hypothetical protein